MAKQSAAGRIVRPAKNGKTQVVRVRARWSPEAEERFLAVLAETCNVTAAAEAAGFSTTAIYKRRMRWPAFAEDWDAAVGQGYARLEAMLVEAATDSLRRASGRDGEDDEDGDEDEDGGDDGDGGDRVLPAMTVREVTNLLRLHRAAVRGGPPQNFGWRRSRPDPDALRASILRKIEAIERAEARVESPRKRGPQAFTEDPLQPTETPAFAGEQGFAGEGLYRGRAPSPPDRKHHIP